MCNRNTQSIISYSKMFIFNCSLKEKYKKELVTMDHESTLNCTCCWQNDRDLFRNMFYNKSNLKEFFVCHRKNGYSFKVQIFWKAQFCLMSTLSTRTSLKSRFSLSSFNLDTSVPSGYLHLKQITNNLLCELQFNVNIALIPGQ